MTSSTLRLRTRTGSTTSGKRYLATGWVRRNFPVSGVMDKGPLYALFQGNLRTCMVESARYDFADFDRMLIAVVAADQSDRPGLPTRVYIVSRIEILSRRPE